MSELYKNGKWLHQKYWEELLSTIEIAKICDVGDETIRRWLKFFDIRRRTLNEALRLRHLKNPDIWNGENHPAWKGGGIKQRGYLLTHQPNHPYATSGGYVLKHRLIAEKALSRYLKPGEIVHHLNEIRDDNRNCNLLICTQSYHKWLHARMRERRKLQCA